MNIYSSVSGNIRKTWLIMLLFVLFIATLAYIYGKSLGGYGFTYAGIAFIIAGITSIGSYYLSDKIILTTSGAKQVTKEDQPELYRIVENLTIGSGLPMPKVYLISDSSLNAFATGRDPKHAVVAVTQGLLNKLSRIELEGVIAHELSHIKNYDIRLMAIVAVLVGFVAILADIFTRTLWLRDSNSRKSGGIFLLLGLFFALISPLIATLIQLAVSRKREFLADASGALLTRYPDGLADALEKIAQDTRPLSTATNATAHLYISNPFKNKSGHHWFTSLFNTHPPIEERIKILREM